jgi:hypothetical protein
MSSSTTCKTIVGVFASRAAAEKVYADLKAEGFRDDQIGLVGKDLKGHVVRKGTANESNAGEGAAAGAAAGAIGGAAVGAGIITGLIPVIGPVLAIGTLGTILLNAAGGAVIAGLGGALIGWGIPEEDAKYYEKQVQAGNYLVTASCEDGEDAWVVMSRGGGYNRRTAPVV